MQNCVVASSISCRQKLQLTEVETGQYDNINGENFMQGE